MAGTLLKETLGLEHGIWKALKEGDAAADAAALLPEFLGVYPDGIVGVEAHAGQLNDGPTIADYQLSEARALALGPEHALLVYHAPYRRVGRDAWEAMYVSSLWRREGNGWRNLFSQDTPLGAGVP